MFKEHGIPNRVDASLLKSFSGSVIKQVISALRFLSLTNESARPQAALKELCDSYGTEQWPGALSGVLRRVYAPMFAIDLAKASAGEINQTFRTAFNVDGETLRKALTFFLNACRDAQITLSPYVLKGAKQRTNNGSKKKAQRPGPQKPTPSAGESETSHPPPKKSKAETISDKALEYKLVDLLKGPDIGEAERGAIWTLI